MLGGMGVPFSRDILRALKATGTVWWGWLGNQNGVRGASWRGFVLVPRLDTIWSVASLTLKKHNPRVGSGSQACVSSEELMCSWRRLQQRHFQHTWYPQCSIAWVLLAWAPLPVSMGSPPPWHGSFLCLLLPPFCLPSVPCASVPKMHNALPLDVSLSLEQFLCFPSGCRSCIPSPRKLPGAPCSSKDGLS